MITMAKCFFCNVRKGKRKCLLGTGLVCSQCCGETRTKEQCEGCTYYQEPKPVQRRYLDVPRFSVEAMDRSFDLQDYANVVESALCLWDTYFDKSLSDESLLRVLELLLDRYHFEETSVTTDNGVLQEGFDTVIKAINEDLQHVPKMTLVQILGVVYYVARRRASGRDHWTILHRHVGVRVGPGLRAMPHPGRS
jgi:hypothetical protein